jgi:hypothetical protein
VTSERVDAYEFCFISEVMKGIVNSVVHVIMRVDDDLLVRLE